jgi:gluconolactonase
MALSSLPLFAALAIARVKAQDVPAQAQIIDQRTWNVLPTVLPSTEVNGSQIFQPHKVTPEDLLAKPFHIYDDEFYSIIGTDPTLTLLAETDTDPLFHEAVVW